MTGSKVASSTSKSALSRSVRRWISTRPALYVPFRRLRNPHTVVTPDTDLLIESYPRSANTWTEALIREASGDKLDLAHHSHAAAHVMLARKLGVPSLIIMRDPDDAVSSFLALYDNNPEARSAFLDYACFYQTVWPLHGDLVRFYSFEDVTARACETIADLAAAFDLPLSSHGLSDEAVFARMDEKAKRLQRRESNHSKGRPDVNPTSKSSARAEAYRAIKADHAASARAAAYEIYQAMQSDLEGTP